MLKERRRKLAILLIFTTLMYTISGFVDFSVNKVSAAQTILVNDDFESGTIPAGYTVTPTPATANNFADVRQDPKNAGNKALFLNDINSATAADLTSIEKSFTPQTSGQLTIEVDFLSPGGVNAGAKVIRLLSSDGTVAANIETKSGSIFTYRRQGNVYDDLPAYVKDTWYKIKVVADIDAKKADVYIDGVKKLTQVAFDNPVTNIAKFDSSTPGSTSRSNYLDNIKVYVSDTGAAAPAKTASLSAVSKDQSVALTWESVTGATYYTVKAGTSSGIYTMQYRTADAASTTYTYGGLTNGTRYYFAVSASNAAGEGPNSVEVDAVPLAAPTKPVIASVDAASGQVTLKWSAVPSATSYNVKSSTTKNGPYVNVGTNVQGTQFTYGSLTNGVTYYLVVSALNGTIEGNNSDEVSATPTNNAPLQAPQNLRVPAMAYDEKSIILAWEKPEDYTSVVDYKVYQDGQLIGTANQNNNVHSPAKPFIDKFYAEEDPNNKYVKVAMHNFTVTGLKANTSYTFTVKAVDVNGVESPASNAVIQSTTPVPQVFNIVDYGAVADNGVTLNTKAIQAAIDAATPGSKVLIPAGKFKSGAIWLKSDMTLELAAGSTLLGSENPADYPFDYMLYDYTTVPRFYSLINAHTYDYGSIRNIRIVGEGTIDGNGWTAPTRTDDGYFPVQPASSNSNYNTYGILAKAQTNYARDTLGLDQTGAYSTRSNLITLRGVENVFYGGFTALNPSNHTLVNLESNQITVTGVKILTFDDNNADGIEFGGGSGLTVFNNIFDTGDDCMNFAAGQGAQGQKEEPTRNSWIFNNYFREGHGAVVIGSHTAAWVEHILAEDNVMFHTDIGLRAKTNTPTGGGGRQIVFRDNAMKDVTNQGFIFTSAYSDVNSVIEYEPAATPAQFKDIIVKNVTVDKTGSDSINVAGVDGGFHENIHFENVTFYNVTKQANINYMKNSSFKNVVFVGLANPWKITNSVGLTFSGTTTTDSVYTDASQPPTWPNGALTASNVTDNTVKLDWTAAADNVKVTSYRIYEGSTLVGSVTTATTFTVTGLTPAHSYTFRVEAADATGNWAAGPSTTATTTGTRDTVSPTAPTGSSIQLADKANTTWLNIKWTAATDNVGVKSYVIYVNGQKKGTVAAPGTTFNATGLSFATEYTFEVEAADAEGNSTRYPYQLKVATAKAYDTGAPKWPAGSAITKSEITSTSVKLSWPAATDDLGVTGYRIYKDGKPLQGGIAFTPVNAANTVSSPITTYTVTGLTPNTTYTFKVEAGDVVSKWTGTGPSLSVTTLSDTVGESPSATLTGSESVQLGQPFTLNYGLSHVPTNSADAIYAQDVTFQFDPNAVEFVSADLLKSTLIKVDVRTNVPGQVRVMFISQGTAGAITTDGPLLALNWKAKPLSQSASTTVSVVQALLSDSQAHITQASAASLSIQLIGLNNNALQAAINNAQSAYDNAVEGTRVGQYPQGSKDTLKKAIDTAKSVLSNPSSTQEQMDHAAETLNQALASFTALKLPPVVGDLNGDRIVNVGDLGIIAAAYGLNSSSSNWNDVKYMDLNNDGIINIVDIVIVAGQITS